MTEQYGSKARQGERRAARYVFAGSSRGEGEVGFKTCPRCGEVLFADMDVCYGCLYDFSRDEEARASKAAGQHQLKVLAGRQGLSALVGPNDHTSDPLDSIELDEIDDEPIADKADSDEQVETALSVPRHSRERSRSSSDTLDLNAVALAQREAGEQADQADMTLATKPYERPKFRLVARSRDMQVQVPLPKGGLSVGRDESNDIILFSRAVSRSHLRLVPLEGEVLAQDCGATNPAQVKGEPLEGELRLVAGETVEVCGTLLRIETEPPDPAA